MIAPAGFDYPALIDHVYRCVAAGPLYDAEASLRAITRANSREHYACSHFALSELRRGEAQPAIDCIERAAGALDDALFALGAALAAAT